MSPVTPGHGTAHTAPAEVQSRQKAAADAVVTQDQGGGVAVLSNRFSVSSWNEKVLEGASGVAAPS